MDSTRMARIDAWMHRNAREVDLALWDCLFFGGSGKAVADALTIYQNPDGGFGHGLDPDNWNPHSLPYACLYALESLHMAGFDDQTHPVFLGIQRYLNATGPEAWHFTLPSNADYPHAVFYNHDPAYDEAERVGVVLALSAYVLVYGRDLPVYDAVIDRLDGLVARITDDDLGDMGPSGYITLIDAMKRAGIVGYDYDALDARLSTVVNRVMQKDEAQWVHYGYRPSDFIRGKDSPFLPGNEAIVEQECRYLLRTLPEDDVWPVTWCWFDNAALYPREEAISLHVAMARKATERLCFLRAFGHL